MGEFSGVEAELIGGATLSLAVSAELKDRIDDAAKNENVSVDTWALRVMEEALKRSSKGGSVRRVGLLYTTLATAT